MRAADCLSSLDCIVVQEFAHGSQTARKSARQSSRSPGQRRRSAPDDRSRQNRRGISGAAGRKAIRVDRICRHRRSRRRFAGATARRISLHARDPRRSHQGDRSRRACGRFRRHGRRSPPRERLFDVLMRRLEILAPHREAVRSLLRSARRNPPLALALNGLAVRSQQWMLTAAGIERIGPARHAPRARARGAVRVGAAHLGS